MDVGANTGMFSLFAHSQARGVRIHAFEPIPPLADILEANLQLYGVDAIVSRIAVGSSSAERPMAFYPRSSLQSSLYADEAADEVVVRDTPTARPRPGRCCQAATRARTSPRR